MTTPITSQPSQIIVLTREHIGDLVCTTPALRSLRKLYPQSHITVEVGERAACVLEHNPNVDEIIIRADHQGAAGKLNFVRLLRRRNFDLAVILDDSTDMPLTVWLGGVTKRVGLARKKRFAGLLNVAVPYDYSSHEMIDNFRNVVAALGADVANRQPELFPQQEQVAIVEALLYDAGLDTGRPILGINPGASAPSNRWPPELFAELANRLIRQHNYQVVLLGGPQDKAMSSEIAAKADEKICVLTGRFKVLELAAALQRFSLLITGDTGPMHIACAMSTPVLALFGPAIPSESGPLYVPGNRVIRKVESCRACTKYDCKRANQCMRLITPDDVVHLAIDMLTNNGEQPS